MAHKTLIGGTSYEISGGKTLISGTGYSIKGGKTLVGGTGYDVPFSSYDPVFANNTWEAIIEACQTKTVPETWVVGNQKAMTIGGQSYTINIIGKNHDTYYSTNGIAPLTFQLNDCYTQYPMNHSDGSPTGCNYSWSGCQMRNNQLPTYMASMPTTVQSAIKSVKKQTSDTKGTRLETTSDTLFLLSEHEVFNSTDRAKLAEGTQYAYYAAGNSKVKKYGSSAKSWWLRSPSIDGTGYSHFCLVSISGNASSTNAGNSSGIAFAFCF